MLKYRQLQVYGALFLLVTYQVLFAQKAFNSKDFIAYQALPWAGGMWFALRLFD
jgi:hypothetical protein